MAYATLSWVHVNAVPDQHFLCQGRTHNLVFCYTAWAMGQLLSHWQYLDNGRLKMDHVTVDNNWIQR